MQGSTSFTARATSALGHFTCCGDDFKGSHCGGHDFLPSASFLDSTGRPSSLEFQHRFTSINFIQETTSKTTTINHHHGHPILTTIYTNWPSTARSAACEYTYFHHPDLSLTLQLAMQPFQPLNPPDNPGEMPFGLPMVSAATHHH
jgi:hypothetical protein